MLINPLTRLPVMRDGMMSRYVSVVLNSTFMAFSPASTAAKRLGRSRYESGPATKSTPWLLISDSFTRSAIQPITPTMRRERRRRRKEARNWRRDTIFCSALSRIEQVLRRMASASSIFSVTAYPAISIIDATTSLSATFIWQPYVSIKSRRSVVAFWWLFFSSFIKFFDRNVEKLSYSE